MEGPSSRVRRNERTSVLLSSRAAHEAHLASKDGLRELSLIVWNSCARQGERKVLEASDMDFRASLSSREKSTTRERSSRGKACCDISVPMLQISESCQRTIRTKRVADLKVPFDVCLISTSALVPAKNGSECCRIKATSVDDVFIFDWALRIDHMYGARLKLEE